MYIGLGRLAGRCGLTCRDPNLEVSRCHCGEFLIAVDDSELKKTKFPIPYASEQTILINRLLNFIHTLI